MTLLGFKKEFASAVERREKRMSIRARDRFPLGKKLQLYTGLRTKAARKLVAEDPTILSVTPIRLGGAAGIVVAGIELTRAAAEQLAIDDGFETIEAFVAFFDKTHGLPFEGVIVRWGWPE
jgi:hypothetical protein